METESVELIINKLDAIIINIIILIVIIMSSKASYIELNIFFIINLI